MTANLSLNTQAILLLTAPLLVGKNAPSARLLSAAEYGRLAQHLHKLQMQPADLIALNTYDLIQTCAEIVPQDRLQALLDRGFLLSQAVEKWHARALWVLSRADPDYPKKLKSRLKINAPPILYGCGPMELLDRGAFAVVGSRHVNDRLIESTKAVGALAAHAHRVLVSGGAKGIDQAAMTGALEAGGRVVGVLADSLEKNVLKRENRDAIKNSRLVLVSPYDPAAGFNVGHAMQRNKLIYGLAEASLVMSSDLEKGGTWAGAIEQLDRLHFVPVYVAGGLESKGLNALLQRGGIAWPNPLNPQDFENIFQPEQTNSPPRSDLDTLLLFKPPAGAVSQDAQPGLKTRQVTPNVQASTKERYRNEAAGAHPQHADQPFELEPAEALLVTLRQLFESILQEPLQEAEIAVRLQVSRPQVKLWIKRFLEEELIIKQKKPVGYILKRSRLFK